MLSTILLILGVVVIITIGAGLATDVDKALTKLPDPRNCSLHGHLFEARYSYTPTISKIPDYSIEKMERLIKATETKTYLHDICIYCGVKGPIS